MKNSQQDAYEKLMQEIWDVKSGLKSYVEFIQQQSPKKKYSYYTYQFPQQKVA